MPSDPTCVPVKVRAVSNGYRDVNIMNGILGNDAAGEMTAAGGKVNGLGAGVRVESR